MLFDLFFWIFYVFCIIVLHELGHLWGAKKLGYKATMSLFSVYVEGDVSVRDDFWIVFFGVATGFLLVLIMPLLGFTLSAWFLTFIFYVAGVRKELVLIWKKRYLFKVL